jgi:uncharacterized protein YcgI (DUF1989 family)
VEPAVHLFRQVVEPGGAFACVVMQGQRARITGKSPVSVVLFCCANVRERLDDSRTRGNQNKLYISTGDYLISKSNRNMMRIVEDTYASGTHDLATGMTEKSNAALCPALRYWAIRPQDVPTPLNLFKTVAIDGRTGRLTEHKTERGSNAYVDLRAEVDCVLAMTVPDDALAEPAAIAVFAQ